MRAACGIEFACANTEMPAWLRMFACVIFDVSDAMSVSVMREFAATGRVDALGVKAMGYSDLNAVMQRG